MRPYSSFEFRVHAARGFRVSSSAFRVHLKPETRNPKRPLQGFTLVELMLVVAIIGMLAAMVVPRLVGRTQQAKISRAKSDVSAIGLALDLYELDLGNYPAKLQELIDEPSSVTGGQWNGPYLKKGVPKDPWGREYQYEKQGSGNKQDYKLWSLGPDGQPGNDDVSNTEEAK